METFFDFLGTDPEYGPWTMIKLEHETLGVFYILIQGPRPSCLFIEDGDGNSKFQPCFHKDEVLKSRSKHEHITLIKITQISPYICSMCKVPSLSLRSCTACLNRYYSCE